MVGRQALYRSSDVRRIDAAVIAAGTSGYVLMQRAGAAALAFLQRRWPEARSIRIVCGPGNNGGDGYVLARLARAAGLAVELIALAPPRTADAQQARADWAGEVNEFDPAQRWSDVDLVVDAIFGIGIARAPSGAAAVLIDRINRQSAAVFALDVPSGVDADTGAAPGAAVRATATLSFIARKRGLYTAAGKALAGQVDCAALDVDAAFLADVPVAAWLLPPCIDTTQLPARATDAHKGMYGHVLAVGGDVGYGGALRLCCEGALRVGAGLVSAITRPEHVAAMLAARPECMVRGHDGGALPVDLVARATVLALGPGLGQDEWGRDLFARLKDRERPAVLDADALNLLARAPQTLPGRVLTPHPGEAARLLGCTTAAVNADRFAALERLIERYQAAVVLKGAGTLVGAPGETPCVLSAGNPGLASGGSGDVLTGVIAGLLAQGHAAFDAAKLGAQLHALAADDAAADGMRGMLASDLFPYLRRRANPC